jgi:hypothetical protein
MSTTTIDLTVAEEACLQQLRADHAELARLKKEYEVRTSSLHNEMQSRSDMYVIWIIGSGTTKRGAVFLSKARAQEYAGKIRTIYEQRKFSRQIDGLYPPEVAVEKNKSIMAWTLPIDSLVEVSKITPEQIVRDNHVGRLREDCPQDLLGRLDAQEAKKRDRK